MKLFDLSNEELIKQIKVLSNSPETLSYLVQVIVIRIARLEEKVSALEKEMCER